MESSKPPATTARTLVHTHPQQQTHIVAALSMCVCVSCPMANAGVIRSVCSQFHTGYYANTSNASVHPNRIWSLIFYAKRHPPGIESAAMRETFRPISHWSVHRNIDLVVSLYTHAHTQRHIHTVYAHTNGRYIIELLRVRTGGYESETSFAASL